VVEARKVISAHPEIDVAYRRSQAGDVAVGMQKAPIPNIGVLVAGSCIVTDREVSQARNGTGWMIDQVAAQ
jgi:hypothetical protein